MGKGWEERYFEDVLPAIEAYAEEETSSFTSSDISEHLDGYTPQKVGKTLKYMTQEGRTSQVLMTGNAPKTWEAVLLDGTAWERVEHELDVEPQERDIDEEELAEEVLENNPEAKEEGLYSRFMDRLRQYDSFNNAAESIEKMRDVARRRKPTLDPGIRQLGEQEYGKIRKNIDDVYEGLEEVREERSDLFRTKHVKEKVDNVRAAEVGIVLSGLAAAGLVERYSDRDGYVPDSVDLESIQEFRRAVKHADSVESLQDFLDFSEEDE